MLRLISSVLACALLNAAADSPASKPAVLAYYTYDKTASVALHARALSFNQVAMDLCSVTEKGVVSGGVPRADLDFAHARGMAAFATVSNYAGNDFNAHVAHAILTSPAATQQLIADMMVRLKEGHYQGINIDFESMVATDREAFTAFIRTVVRQMKAAGYLTMVSVPAKEKDDPANSWDGAFDYRALGAAADVLQVMTYDENGPWGQPGPVAGLDWVERCIRFAVSAVPPAKINLGVPAFGYDWDLQDKKQSKQITWTEFNARLVAVHTAPEWDEATASAHYSYTENGHAHVVWGENARSLRLKARLVAKYHLAGVSVYALGMEDAAFWKALTTEL